MPTNLPEPMPDSPRGPVSTPGLPDRSQEQPPKPPIGDESDNKNINDPLPTPALLPIGDPAGAA